MPRKKSKSTGRKDPFLSFKFWVEIDGIVSAAFSKVSGLAAEVEYETYEQGGDNDHVYRAIKRIKYPNLVLERGMTTSNDLWGWYQKTASGKPDKKSGAVVLVGLDGKEKNRWNFSGAYPVKWESSDFSSTSSDTVIEKIEIVHDGIKKS